MRIGKIFRGRQHRWRSSTATPAYTEALESRILLTDPGTITIIAGGGEVPQSGDPAIGLTLDRMSAVVLNAAGDVYFADSTLGMIFKTRPGRTVDIVAGAGTDLMPDNGDRAEDLNLSQPVDLAMDSAGNLYVADTGFELIFRIKPDGTIDVIAGGGADATPDTGDMATNLDLDFPSSVAVDTAGNVFFGDNRRVGTGIERILKVATNGTIEVIAGGGADDTPDNGDTATSLSLQSPEDVAVDSAGNLFFADLGLDRVIKVKADGTIETVAGGGADPVPDDGDVATDLELFSPEFVEVDSAGNVFYSDGGLTDAEIVKVKPDGTVKRIAGFGADDTPNDGDSAGDLSLAGGINSLALDPSDRLVLSGDELEQVIQILDNGTINVPVQADDDDDQIDNGDIATRLDIGLPFGVAADSSGNVFFANVFDPPVKVRTNGQVQVLASAAAATDVEAENDGSILISGFGLISRIAPDGTATTVAGGGNDSKPDNGDLATDLDFGALSGVAADGLGNVYFALDEFPSARVIRVNPDGTIHVVAGGGTDNSPNNGDVATDLALDMQALNSVVAADTAGNVYFVHDDFEAPLVIKAMPDGTIRIVAGGGSDLVPDDGDAATDLDLGGPSGIDVDADGNLYIADQIGGSLLKVRGDGTVEVIAGTGPDFSPRTGELARNLGGFLPVDVDVDQDGNIVFSSNQGHVIRVNVNPPRLTASLDVDEDGAALPLSDGILALRYLAGFNGNTLVDGAVNPAGGRTDPDEIVPYLDGLRDVMLDVDLDGQFLPLSDGILLLRFLAGFTGPTLVEGAVNPAGARTDPDEIAAFLSQFLPPQPGPLPKAAGSTSFTWAPLDEIDDLFTQRIEAVALLSGL